MANPKTVRCLVLCDIPALGLKCGQVAEMPPAVAKANASTLDTNEAAVASAGSDAKVIKVGGAAEQPPAQPDQPDA